MTFVCLCLLLNIASAQPAFEDPYKLGKNLEKDHLILKNYEHAQTQINLFTTLGLSEDLLLWQDTRDQILSEILQTRRSAVELAIKIYQIPESRGHIPVENFDANCIEKFSTGMCPQLLDLSPFRNAEWTVEPSGAAALGNEAFHSPASLGASLWALHILWDHQSQWPSSIQDQHLALALTERQVLSKTAELHLSSEESAQWEERSKRHEEHLDEKHKIKLAEGTWPFSLPQVNSQIPKNATLYTPPFLNSTESLFKMSLRADDAPVAHVPILLAQSKEAGYTLQDILTTDDNGQILVRLIAPLAPLLIVPLGAEAPFPHRIPIVQGSSSSTSASRSPELLSLPVAVEPQTEQAFLGTNLLLEDGKTSFSMSGHELPILCVSPSFLLTALPSRLPVSQTFKVTTQAGSFEATVPMVVIRGRPEKKALTRGEHSKIILEEWGLPKINVWIAADHPRIVFDDTAQKGAYPGSSKKIVELLEKTPLPVQFEGVVPGPFHLSFGVANPDREEMLTKLEALRANLKTPSLLDLLEKSVWTLQQGEIGKAESLIEQLRYDALVQEGKTLPTDERAFDLKFLKL